MSTTTRRKPWAGREVAGMHTTARWPDGARSHFTSGKAGKVETPEGLVFVQVFSPTDRDDGAVYLWTHLGGRAFHAHLPRWTSERAIAALARRWLRELGEYDDV